MTHSQRPRRASVPGTKTVFLLSLAAFPWLAMTGCSALGFESNYDKQVSYEFDSGFEGKDQKVLPEWLPNEAVNVKEIVRSTGNERILRADLAGALPRAVRR